MDNIGVNVVEWEADDNTTLRGELNGDKDTE
jgi:hypothetical protein